MNDCRPREKCFRINTKLFASYGHEIATRWYLTPVLILLGGMIIGGCIPGLFFFVEEKSDITELYVHEASRLNSELGIFNDNFGLSRQQALLYTSTTGNVATKKSLDAALHSLAPILKHDETSKCAHFDDDVTSRPALCDTNPYGSDSLYCTCNNTAASPDEISITWTGHDENGDAIDVPIYQKDLCETAPVPESFRPSSEASVPAAEPIARTKPVYIGALASALSTAEDSLASIPLYASLDRDSLVTSCENLIQMSEAARNRSDLITSGLSCYAMLIENIGTQASLGINSTLNTTGLSAMWAAYALNSSLTLTELRTEYQAGAGADGLDLEAADTVSQTETSVTSISRGLSLAVVQAYSSVQYFFATENNMMSYGYQAVAACLAQFTDKNRERLETTVFDSVLASVEATDAFLINNIYGVTEYDKNGTKALKAFLSQQLQDGVSILTDLDVQRQAFELFFTSGASLYDLIVSIERNNTQTTLSTTGLSAMRIKIFDSVLSNGTIPTNQDLRSEYIAANGGLSSSVDAAKIVIIAAEIHLDISRRASEHIIDAVFAAESSPTFLIDSSLTVNGTFRPLHRKWGIDRFPCTRITPLDMFSEGNFDLPLNLKFLERISGAMHAFFTIPIYESFRQEAQCIEKHLVQPVKEAVYLNSLPSRSSYQGANFAALDAAEVTFVQTLQGGANAQTAGQNAVLEFLSKGGMFFSDESPISPSHPTAEQRDSFAAAIGRATLTASEVESRFSDVLALFARMGYSQRPSYQTMSSDALKSTILNGIAFTMDDSVTNSMCLAGNTDDSGMGTGTFIDTCLLSWSGTKQPIQLVYGDVSDNNVLATRAAINHWNQNLPLFRNLMADHLNRNDISASEYEKIHRAFEESLIDYLLQKIKTVSHKFCMISYLFSLLFTLVVPLLYPLKRQPLHKGQSGSGFENVGPFSTENLEFTTQRSTSDTFDEAAKITNELLISASIILAVYVGFSIYNLWSSIYSHSALAIWGLAVVVGSLLASLGLGSYMGVSFTAISTNVVPFLAIGIGIDDMFVLLRTYAREVRDGTKARHILTRVIGTAGPSVLFTSFANLVAVLVALGTPVQVVQLFAYQMALNVVLNFLLLFLLFVPAIYLDCLRVLAGRADFGIMCINDEKRARNHSFLDRFFRETYSNILFSTPVRVFVVLAFCTWCALAIWQGFFFVGTGLRISDVSNKDSYQYKFASVLENNFQMYSGSVITHSDDFPNAQQNILFSLKALQQAESVSNVPSIGELYWLHNFLQFSTGNATQAIDPPSFYQQFALWLEQTGTVYAADLACKDSNTGERVNCFDIVGAFSADPPSNANPNVVLSVVRGTYYLQDLAANDDFTAAIRETRRKLDPVVKAYGNRKNDTNYDTFAIGYVHIIWEQYLHTDLILYLVVGLCIVGIFIATLVLHLNILGSTIISIVVLMVTLEVYGLLPIWGVQKNAFSIVNLCIAVGMGVEFTAHITHQFLAEQGIIFGLNILLLQTFTFVGDSRIVRARNAIGFMGSAMFHGAVSSLLAATFIAGSDLTFIREYFFGIFFSTILVAALNGIVFLPVVLSFIGPSPINVDDELETDDGDNTDAGEEFETMAVQSRMTMTPVVPHTQWGDNPEPPIQTETPIPVETKEE